MEINIDMRAKIFEQLNNLLGDSQRGDSIIELFIESDFNNNYQYDFISELLAVFICYLEAQGKLE
jgi:hypothetical protein